MTRHMTGHRELAIAGLVGLTVLAVYVFTLNPGVAGGDPGEAQFVPRVLGIMHYTGYPLYTLLGWAWSYLVPVGSVAWRMNLLSAVLAGVTVALLYLVGRQLRLSPGAAVVGALSWPLVGLVWLWSTVAGGRTLTACLAVLVTALALWWGERPTSRRFLLLAFVYGLGLAHHRTTILAAPALALYVLLVLARERRAGRACAPRRLTLTLVAATALTALPLLFYLYLPIRSALGSPFDLYHPDTLDRFLDLVTARQFATTVLPLTSPELPGRAGMLWDILLREFGWLGTVLGLLGFVALWFHRERWRGALLVALTFAPLALFTLLYDVQEGRLNVVFLIPAYALFALWVGAGADAVRALVAWAWRRRETVGHWAGAAVVALMLLLLLPGGWARYQAIEDARAAPLDLHRQFLQGSTARRFVDSSLSAVAPGTVIVCDWEQAAALWVAQFIEGQRPDVVVRYPIDLVLPLRDEVAARGQSLYMARALPEIVGQPYLSCEGAIIRVGTAPATELPAPATRLDVPLEDGLSLAGYRTSADSVVSLTLWWQARQALPADYSASVRLVDREGRLIDQADNAHPVLGCYPTTLWSPGEVVGDYYELSLRGAAPGPYHIDVVVYQRLPDGGFRNLALLDVEPRAEVITLPPFDVR
ncbi:MAG: DUF2723 domain-containing protein [Chloroflexi bacterium]|nr:DUF2723 domain-containing protein [Chloroflexota bacterium]